MSAFPSPLGSDDSASPSPNGGRGPSRRRWRNILKWSMLLLALLVVAWLLLTRGIVGRKLAERGLSRALGGVVTLDQIAISPSGVVVADGMRVRVPGIAGPAAEVLSAARVEAKTTLAGLLRGNPEFSAVTVDKLTARISQNIRTGKVNLAGLSRGASAAGSSALSAKLAEQMPQIALRGGVIELGEHDDASADGTAPFTILKSLGVSGTIERLEESGASVISFRQTSDGQSAKAAAGQAGSGQVGSTSGNFIARGRIDASGVTLNISGIDFSSLSPTQTPKAARELFAESMLEGSVPDAELVYSFDGSWRSRITLAGVSMNLPVETTAEQTQTTSQTADVRRGQSGSSRRMRLLNTSGTVDLSDAGVQAQLSGYIEELPYIVSLKTDGPSVSSAWTVTMRTDNFQLERNPEILRFVPPVVRERLADFGNPTGVVDAVVTVSRGAVAAGSATSPESQVKVKGTLNLRDVKAKFHKFPYAWEHLRGVVEFDEQRVVFREISGDAPSGAKVRATVAIEPPTDIAGVEVNVQVENMPIDDALASAMRARKQGRVLAELIDADAYPALHPALLASGMATPPALGGTVDVNVAVQRAVGERGAWTDRVEIRMDDVLLLPKALSYPLRAQPLTIVQSDNVARAKGVLRGLTGAEISLDTTINLNELVAQEGANEDAPFNPPFEAKLETVPIDAILLASLSQCSSVVANRVAGALQGLGASGTLGGDIRSSGTQVRGKLHAFGEASPRNAQGVQDGKLTFTNVRTTVEVDPEYVSVMTNGRVPGSTSAIDDIQVTLNLPTQGEDSLRIVGNGLDLQMDVARAIRPFAPKVAERVQQAQAFLAPAGKVNVEGIVRLVPAASPRSTTANITLTPTTDIQLGSGDERFGLQYERGSVGIGVGETGTTSLFFSMLTGTINQASQGSDASATPAALKIAGALLIERGERDVAAKAERPAGKARVIDLEQRIMQQQSYAIVDIDNVALAGSFTRAALRALGETQLLEDLESTQADGLADVRVVLGHDVLLRSDAQRTAIAQGELEGVPEDFFAKLTPKSLTLGYGDKRLRYDNVGGEIIVEGTTGGRVRELSLEAPGLVKALANGAWGTALANDRLRAKDSRTARNELDMRIALEASGLHDHARALLPRDVAATLVDLEIASDKPITLANLSLRGTFSETNPQDQLQTFAASGTVNMQAASAKLGVQIDDARGACQFQYVRTAPNEPGEFRVNSQLAGLRVLGVGLTDGNIALRSTPRGGILAEQFSAQVHGGRITGSLTLAPPVMTVLLPGQPAPGRWFELSVEASNVRFAPLVEEGRALRGAALAAVEPDLAPDGSRGVLSGSLTLAGQSDDEAQRRGRGTLTVRGGTVVALPVVLPLLRVSNLQLPSNDTLDYALADFYLRGNQVTLEQLSISSRAVGLYGFGTIGWPTFDLDLRFRAANRSRIPVITAILEGVRDELVSTTVRGTLDNPQVSLKPLEGTRGLLRGLTGGQASAQERKMQAIEKQISPEERRARPGEEELIEPRK